MSMLTMRHTIERRRAALTCCISGATLFTTAGLAVAQTTTRPTTAAVSTTAAPQTLGVPTKAPSVTWDLADIANPRVDKWVQRFTNSLKRDFTAALSRGRAYSDMISQKLAARGMPNEFFYLAMIESEFKPVARSRVSAVGLWQFMASTARRFGLTVGGHSDDRTNPPKATDAALAYLAQLHAQFGSWYLAAAAYNAGPGTVASALRLVTGSRSGTDADFYRIAAYLPAETRDYVPKLIAAARIGKQPATYGLAG
jgi:membrane-bound lytic murein transglycosylase D